MHYVAFVSRVIECYDGSTPLERVEQANSLACQVSAMYCTIPHQNIGNRRPIARAIRKQSRF